MTDIKHILLAYDFSDGAKVAVKEAFHLAKSFGAKVSVVHVMDKNISDDFLIPLSAELETKIDEMIRQDLGSSQGVEINDILVKKGMPYADVLKVAHDLDCDLIVVGAHGSSLLQQVFLGSVAEKIVRLSSVPVFVAREDSSRQCKKILIPIDTSDASEVSIDYAKPYAAKLNAQMQLISVVDVSSFGYYIEYESILKAAMDKAREKLTALKEKHGITTDVLVLEGNAKKTLSETVEKDKGIGLVMMSTHGRTGFNRFVIGSVAEHVVRHIPCSIVTLKHPKVRVEAKEFVENHLLPTVLV